jgi:hypothetical protein
MHRKFVKQFIYISFYLACWALIIFLFYITALRPAPTCFDKRQNQKEEQVDCGGPNCATCALRSLIPIKVFPVKVLPAPASNRSTFVLQLQNQNTSYGADPFNYKISVYSSASTSSAVFEYSGSSFIYPGEIKYITLPNLEVAYSASLNAQMTVVNQSWQPLTDFPQPQMQTRQTQASIDVVKKQALITGILKNDNPFPVSSATIYAVLYNDVSTLVGASKTFLENLTPSEERFFQIVVPLSDISTVGVQPDYKLSIEVRR